MAALRSLIDADAPDADAVRSAISELQTATMKIGEALNKQTPPDSGADKAEDAEYADKKEEEKK
jgi:hypothetical protein